MPIYEYECSSCCHVFEKKQRFDDEPIAICPKCRAKSHRVIRSVPVIFKGSGFYITDNRKSDDTAKPKEPVLNKKED
jgi:putative FmdB family regulatory protein